MSHERQHSRKHRLVRVLARGALAAVIVVACAYMVYRVYASRTSSWPEARECTVIGSRVVHTVKSPGMRHPQVLWQGEYHVQYTVNEKRYFLWAESGLAEVDRSILEDKIRNPPTDCPFRVLYNPNDPSESVAYREVP